MYAIPNAHPMMLAPTTEAITSDFVCSHVHSMKINNPNRHITVIPNVSSSVGIDILICMLSPLRPVVALIV